ncbi:actin maturation protease-like [Tubulanus polymorphus]|uniref:actin maturation protease-like n=1 Tax=Tubulanus polymorphus TaxID=672921 RepID=UPI003DA59780
MSSSLPPRPPPLPPVPPPLPSKTIQQNSVKPLTIFYPLDNIIEEIHHVLRRKLSLLSSEKSCDLLLSHYMPVPSLLQDGPMCGLVALQLAAECLKVEINAKELLKVAQNEGWSKQGEIFNAKHISLLVEKCLKCNAELITGGLDVNQEKISQHLMNGLPVLIPYDSDGNHEPCFKKGHKAHWAVLTGMVLVFNKSDYSAASIHELHYHQDEMLPNVFHAEISKDMNYDEKRFALMDYKRSDIYVYAKHGKSKYLDLWNYEQLAASNNNLVEVSGEILQDRDNFVIPIDGVISGLMGRSVLIWK